MIEVASSKIEKPLRAYFDLVNVPGKLRFYAVLTGDNRGKIWTDNPDKPTWGVIQESAFGTLHLQGQFPDNFLSDFINERRKHGEVCYGFWEGRNDYRDQMPSPQYEGYVLESENRSVSADLTPYLRQHANTWKVHALNPEFFEAIQDYQFYTDMFGSPERALTRGFGFCVVVDGIVVSEAFAGTSFHDVIEIGINTRETHRRQGYALLACAHTIHEAEKRGYRTYWNCAAQNTASAALAHRLGYQPMQKYQLLGWF